MTWQRMSQPSKAAVQFGTVLGVGVPCLRGRSLLLLAQTSPKVCRTGVSYWKAPKVLNKTWLWFLVQPREYKKDGLV